MNDRQIRFAALVLLAMPLFAAVPVFAHGDKVIPHVVDGIQPDGTGCKTRFDITNLGPVASTRISKVKVLFFQQNGSPWNIDTNLGTASEFPLDLGAFQTIRIETLGAKSLERGYAIVRNLENTTVFAEDYEVAITVYYEVRKGNNVVDTVSVLTGQPTVVWVFPLETDISKNIYTGFAVVNLSNSTNTVNLRLWRATTPSSENAADSGTAIMTLNPNEQRALFLMDSSLFPNATNFKGMLLGTSEKPVAILALVQTDASIGVQFATVVPAYADALRRNTYMYLRQGFPLDADIPISDYYGNADDSIPWDLLYESSSSTTRQLTPRSGATVALIGQRNPTQFDDDVNLPYLQGLTYSSTAIDLGNASPNLAQGIAFAVRTGLGRYVKVRIADVIVRDSFRDLALEIYVYK